ncbi:MULTISPECIES: hypothetical protein [Pectobacterium]|uniref:hypothetical protein n=1 Tax=Pectobacterium TaxID=122277 RepID=UPI000505E540|nr:MULTISPECIES: hypothetical protein [Pectobacterium]KAA3667202.1 hypothetical protein FEV48_11840 [Pectobacterium carotovorum subsp. carotovorum]KFX10314.1 hypothetical protein KP17_19240 [Pectobacterium parvum]MCL6354377.1 hypothetical protein [Pectobacterium parmentieri]QHP58870.1 hypothetical protein EH204_13345 [Pectobacterium carotovorum subsp. carotovorum]GKW36721.1 hypothetical protein PEC301875_07450 [Pectobacterium carotovorum subsp. carotovorum]
MKTVFVLGAGFSKEAGAPMQAEIMDEIFKIRKEKPSEFDDSEFILFENLLTKHLYYKCEQFKDIQIEDIFTPLDRCLADNIQFRGLSIEQMIKTRDAIFNIIGVAIKEILIRKGKSKEYIDIFAQYLVKRCSERMNNNYRQHDPVSVISTNWDILLDNSIYNYIQQNYSRNAVVDYCCYISSLEKMDDTVKPGLEMLGIGGFNVKLLKIHGSLNWLQCSRCMRLYVGFNEKAGILRGRTCRHCDKNHDGELNKNKLISNLIMPTFLKDLSNPQYKIIWQNAGIELSEADRLIFIGYSLPSADFEMRQLLSRMIKRNVEIEIVTYEENPTEESKIKGHWEAFFGKREIKIHLCGASRFIEKYYT